MCIGSSKYGIKCMRYIDSERYHIKCIKYISTSRYQGIKSTLYQGGGGGEGRLTGGAQGPGKIFDCSKNCGEFLSLV